MHIAYLTETWPPEINGVALTAARTVAWLRARGHAVHLVRPRQPHERPRDTRSEWRTGGLPIPLYRDLRIGLATAAALQRRWKATPPSLVHVATEGVLGHAGVRAARALGLPVTSDFRTNFHQYSAHYGMAWLAPAVGAWLRRLHNATDRTFVPTEQTRAELAAQGYARLEVVGRGVDTSLFTPARRDALLRAAWRAGPRTPVLLHVGRLAPEKNLLLALAAYEAVRARQPDARLVLVGDGPWAARLQARCPQAIFAGVQRGDALARHYASADLFVLPSLTETFGNVTLEALAAGLPVAAYRNGAAAVHVREGLAGLLADPGDERGFIANVVALAATPHRAGWSLHARAAAAPVAWEAVLTRFERALATVVRAHPGAHGQPAFA